MSYESFENPETAAFMNEHFVNIKVDREQRLDPDGIYMSGVVALTGQEGWAVSYLTIGSYICIVYIYELFYV
jgi:uncharacterized protein